MKISIITATWNRADTIRSTIESVLCQTYNNWEHIIIDGASSDNTIDIIREYNNQYARRLILVSEPDKGIYDAMNKGLALATGDVIGILNSDDFYADRDALYRIATALSDTDVDAVYGDTRTVLSNDLTKVVRRHSGTDFSKKKMIAGFQPSHPTYYARKSVYDKFGGFDASFRIAADFENLLRTIYLGNINLKYIPHCQVIMRSGGVSKNGMASYKVTFREHKRAFNQNGLRFFPLLAIYRMGYRYIRKKLGLTY